MVFKLFGWKKQSAPQPEAPAKPVMDTDAILEEMRARTGADTRAAELPAWALLFRSPFKSYPAPTSWLGGVPRAPRSFSWPKGDNGRPLSFVAQIDLSAMADAPGLPEAGALLVFTGDGYAVQVLSSAEVEQSQPVSPPWGLPDLKDLGYWGQGNRFNAWAVDPVPFISRNGEIRPSAFPDPFAQPSQWIGTWGLAALEAGVVVQALEKELRMLESRAELRRKREAEGNGGNWPAHAEQQHAHWIMMKENAPNVMAALQAWHDRAVSMPKEGPVDQEELAAVLSARMSLSGKMQNNYGTKHLMGGNAHMVWTEILKQMPAEQKNHDFSSIPPEFRPFVEAKITDWRGHRLFGLEPEFPNNFEDLRGQDPLISIAADPLVGTETEHDYGFSIWLNRETMAQGRHGGGQLIHHCAV